MNIAVLTSALTRFDPAYSLSHVITDQWTCLRRHGHDVAVFVSDDFTGIAPDGMSIWPVLPNGKASDIPNETAGVLSAVRGFDIVFTHDWVNHERMRPYLEGLWKFAPTDDRLRWYHWIHSAPMGPQKPWWDLNRLPNNHSIVYPNTTDRENVASQFDTDASRVSVIPHIVDPRSLFDFSPELWVLTDKLPGLLSADFVEIYPAATDRLIFKGVDKLIDAFGAIKAEGYSVCCLVVNSWSERLPPEDLRNYRRRCERVGLDETEFAFMTDLDPEFRGMPRTDLLKLTLLSNLFIDPTMGEAFGLTLPEAILAGAYPVPNGSLPMLDEVCPDLSVKPEFGSCVRARKRMLSSVFNEQTAQEIIESVQKDVAIVAKTRVRQQYNMDRIYKDYYEPLLVGETQLHADMGAVAC